MRATTQPARWTCVLALALSLALAADGRLVVAGRSADNMAVARYHTDGSLDTTFDMDGKLTTDLGGSDTAQAVAILDDGKIVVSGTDGRDFALVRYNSDGSLDTSFGADGIVTTDFDGEWDSGRDLAVTSAGEFVVVVLGHPSFYPRFGFRPAWDHGLYYIAPGPNAAFMVAELERGALEGRSGEVVYHAAFDAV